MNLMKKYLLICFVILILGVAGYTLYYNAGVDFDISKKETTTFMKTSDKEIYIFEEGEYQEFEIRGVNVGAGVPGHFATAYAITKEQYLSWFDDIKKMGANTIRVYTILGPDFYDAFYEYNNGNDDPLYLIHGVWLNDYVHFSYRDAFHSDIIDALKRDSRILVDIIWGNRNFNLGKEAGTGSYRNNISPWVIGYILGVEWEDLTVAYTDDKYKNENVGYSGKYMYTTGEASPFESILAEIGDNIIDYETKKYGQQRLVAFSNWPVTDPFDYNTAVTYFFKKCAKVDVEHIKTTEEFVSGTFASYHVYPYYPDYLSYEYDLDLRIDGYGEINTYFSYLKLLAEHHTIPVVISEYGLPSSRGIAKKDKHTSRNQGGMSESEQAEGLIRCYNDIMDAGCCGSIVFAWQDEWFKRTWNTMHVIDLNNTAYWSDYQTNEQYFGLLSFDPGQDRSICYVDGDIDEWENVEPMLVDDNLELSMMYDEKFVYFMVESSDVKPTEPLYIPIDITPNSGSSYCSNFDINMDKPVDFVMYINGSDISKIVVQERYDGFYATYGEKAFSVNPYVIPPEKDSSQFNPIYMMLFITKEMDAFDVSQMGVVEFSGMKRLLPDIEETGVLQEGNANPYKENYNSLSDFMYGEGCVEIKIPWQLLNFYNANEMKIHDDYYECYGVESFVIESMNVGAKINPERTDVVKTMKFMLEPWNYNVTYHERLKESYYAFQEIWVDEEVAQ